MVIKYKSLMQTSPAQVHYHESLYHLSNHIGSYIYDKLKKYSYKEKVLSLYLNIACLNIENPSPQQTNKYIAISLFSFAREHRRHKFPIARFQIRYRKHDGNICDAIHKVKLLSKEEGEASP